MRRVAIIGSPGSGKSTLARALRDLTGLPLHYLDMLWHLPDGDHVTRTEFDAAHAELVSRERWIIDGTYLRTLPARVERADLVVLLDLPLETCLDGIRTRIGKAREDLPWQETELDPEFVDYVERFPDEQLPRIRELLEARPQGCQLVELRSREEAERASAPGGLLWKLANPVNQLDAQREGHMDEKNDWRVAENRANWDDRAAVHAASPFYEVERLVADRSYVSPVARRDFEVLRPHLGPDELEGRSVLHLQCHIGTDTLCWERLGASEVWGLDFSPASLEQARAIAGRSGASVTYVEGDARFAADAIDRTFDVVVTGTGALQWLPELSSWARSIARLLAPGGVLVVRDDHPLLGALLYESLEVHADYLSGFCDDYEDDGSYVPGSAGTIAHTSAHNWNHDFQEILGSLLAAGLAIEDFRESPFAEWRSLPRLVETADGWTMPAGAPRIPLTFAVVARKPA